MIHLSAFCYVGVLLGLISIGFPLCLATGGAVDANVGEAGRRGILEKTHNSSKATSPRSQCGFYFARSTIPGAGNGLFAGRPFEAGDVVTAGDITVAITDFSFHNGGSQADWFFLWDDYTWEADSFTGMMAEATESYGASFGVGASINCLRELTNVEPANFGQLDGAGLHRSRDPGAGAFTHYHDRKGLATEHIPAGMEFFVDYGEGYFYGKEEAYGIPGPDDFAKARAVLEGFQFLRNEFSSDTRNIGASESNSSEDLFELIHQIKHIWFTTALRALPIGSESVDEVLSTSMEKAHYNRSIQSIQWLEENGSCADNLRSRPSRIRQAGRGAFTQRSIPKGETIVPMPLIHLYNRSLLDMYRLEETSDGPVRDMSGPPIHQQLLLNYCFGHADTDILLCPYGGYNGLINHSPTSEQANAKLVWSSKHMLHREWLDQPIEEWVYEKGSGLAFDVVATRDLDEDEEVFIDYGVEWETAWQDYVNDWTPPPHSEHFKAESDWSQYLAENEKNVDSVKILHVPLVGEKRQQAHATIQDLYCHYLFQEWWGLAEKQNDSEDSETSSPCRAVGRYTKKNKDGEEVTVYSVEILIRDDSTIQSEDEEEDDWNEEPGLEQCTEEVEAVLFGVPSQIFLFSNRPYTRDQAQVWSFRHDMRIPDEIMPLAWRRSNATTVPKTIVECIASTGSPANASDMICSDEGNGVLDS